MVEVGRCAGRAQVHEEVVQRYVSLHAIGLATGRRYAASPPDVTRYNRVRNCMKTFVQSLPTRRTCPWESHQCKQRLMSKRRDTRSLLWSSNAISAPTGRSSPCREGNLCLTPPGR